MQIASFIFSRVGVCSLHSRMLTNLVWRWWRKNNKDRGVLGRVTPEENWRAGIGGPVLYLEVTSGITGKEGEVEPEGRMWWAVYSSVLLGEEHPRGKKTTYSSSHLAWMKMLPGKASSSTISSCPGHRLGKDSWPEYHKCLQQDTFYPCEKSDHQGPIQRD